MDWRPPRSTSFTITAGVAAPTTTAIASTVNPAPFGLGITFSATVSSTVNGTPSGSVQFYDGSQLIGSGLLSLLGGHEVATFTTSTLSVGVHSITAVYGGDSNFANSTSSPMTESIGAVPTSTAVMASTIRARSARASHSPPMSRPRPIPARPPRGKSTSRTMASSSAPAR